jgi:hypothetical protein
MSAPSTPQTATEPQKRSRARIVGIVISAVVGALLVFDAVTKLFPNDAVKDAMAKLGFPAGQALILGIVLTICLVVYAIPRTSVLGALGITAYLGGAVTANMRIEAPLFSTVLSAVYVGVLLWVGLVLRRPELLKVAGIKG